MPCLVAPCLACLDQGRRLLRLPDEVKEAIAQHLSIEDLGRCLLASKSGYCSELTKHYLSEAGLLLETTRMLNKLETLHNTLDGMLTVIEGQIAPDVSTHKQTVAQLEGAFKLAYGDVDSFAMHVEQHIASASITGICSRFLADFTQITGFLTNLLKVVAHSKEQIQRMAAQVLES